MKRRLLLIGLDGAERSIVSGLLDAGLMPQLHGIVERGCFGALAAPSPLVRAMLWTTVASGVRAPHHGVCGGFEVRDDGAGVRPTEHSAWRVPALWQVATAAGVVC